MKKKKLLEEQYPLTWRKNQDMSTIWIEEYRKKNGYNALIKSLKNFKPLDLVNLIVKSELKGRGGAGFPTGLKWKLMGENKTREIRYLICNADEMEPGTYKDKFLIEMFPHQLIEGIIISAFAIQASHGYIFLRGDYYHCENILKKSLSEALKYGFLGNNICNSDFSFNLYLHTGAGRYICGEETALINSLEGKRANPRSKPPFPAICGLWGFPTCVNNVETLCNIPNIVLNGSLWFKKLSKSNDSGTKIMGFSGNVKKSGLWEVPFGISARELLEDYAEGMKKGSILKAWQPGGAGTDFFTENSLDISMDYQSFQKIGSRLGTGIAMAVDTNINIISLLVNIETFFSRESCGFCTPCREGLPWILKILKNLEKKKGKPGDIQLLEEICKNLAPGKTFCAHAPGAISPILSAIKNFRIEFQNCILRYGRIIKDVTVIFSN